MLSLKDYCTPSDRMRRILDHLEWSLKSGSMRSMEQNSEPIERKEFPWALIVFWKSMFMDLSSLELKAAACSELSNLKIELFGTAEGVLIMDWICWMKGEYCCPRGDCRAVGKRHLVYSPLFVECGRRGGSDRSFKCGMDWVEIPVGVGPLAAETVGVEAVMLTWPMKVYIVV